jgi:hypothetical protein
MAERQIISDVDEIFDILSSLADANRPSIRRNLRGGNRVKFSSGKYWEIDNPNIFRNLPKSDEYGFPLSAIYRTFPGSSKKRDQLFEEVSKTRTTNDDIQLKYSAAPFSLAVERETGVCLERSVLFQLWQQDRLPTFLLSGLCQIGVTDYHAYNAVFPDGRPLLVDVKPRGNTNGAYDPFVVPITALDLMSGELILEKRLSAGRHYSATHLKSEMN